MRGLVRAPSSWRAVTLILIRCWLCLESSQRGRARSQSLLQMALLVRCWLSAGYQRVCAWNNHSVPGIITAVQGRSFSLAAANGYDGAPRAVTLILIRCWLCLE